MYSTNNTNLLTNTYMSSKNTINTISKYTMFINTMTKTDYDTTITFIKKFKASYSKNIDIEELAQKISKSLPQEISLNDYYNYVADQSVMKTSYHPDYNKLASEILVARLHNITSDSIIDVANILYNNKDSKNNHYPLITRKLYYLIISHSDKIQEVINYNRDYDFDYFGIRTMERSYLLKIKLFINNKSQFIIVERPQHMFMRVALAIHGKNLKDGYESYNLMTLKYFTHATPTLFNAGTLKPQLSSCYLVSCDDSMEKIFATITQIACISKWAGGIGVHISAVRPKGSIIRGTNGESDGIIPLCVVLNKVAKYVNQGGKRNGSIACYLEPWHVDIFEFCELRKNTGSEDLRARDLFLALWIPDIFMERVRDDKLWSLMCSDECPDLPTTHGDVFNSLYLKYESNKKFVKQVSARKLWKHILECQIETGFPYMLYKDNANKKSNQQNLGTIRSSNLCAEIIEYSDGDETAVCMTADTEILTENGYKKIIDCDKKNVLTFFESDDNFTKKIFYQKAKLVANGIKKIYKIKPFGCRPIKLTADHKVIVYNMINNNIVYTWKQVKDLKPNDLLLNPIVNTKYSESLFIFNEEITNLGICFATNDNMTTLTEEEYNLCVKYSIDINKKQISNKIKSEEPNILANFMAGIFSVKGKIYSVNKEPVIYMDNPTPELLYDIQQILSCYSIHSYVYEYSDMNRLIINDFENIKLFAQKIGFKPNNKQKILSMLITQYINILKNPDEIIAAQEVKNIEQNKDNNINPELYESCKIEIVNLTNDIIKQTENITENVDAMFKNASNILKQLRLIKRKDKQADIECSKRISKQHEQNEDDNKKLVETVIKTKEIVNNKKILKQNMRKIIKTEIIEHEPLKIDSTYNPETYELVSIESITELPEEPVYDIILNNYHSFIANGIVIHNCNLVSICLPKFIEEREIDNKQIKLYNYDKLMDVCRVAVRNLNRIIDKNFYPVKETKTSNLKHRPIGIGVQGLADVYNILSMPWESEQAREINKRIFESIYFACIDESKELAKKFGHYDSFINSPFSQQKLQFDLWNIDENKLLMGFDWKYLKQDIAIYGTRNSLLTALMPTASTAQIMGNYEGFEPYLSNMFVRTTLAGEFIVINQNLISDLEKLNLWNENMRKLIIINNGSIQNINNIPDNIKQIYKTAFEIKLKDIITQSIERGAFIDQSQSMNLFLKSPDFTLLTSAHFYGWKNGLKTGMYYLRSASAVNPINFGIDINDIKLLTGSNNILDIINNSYYIKKNINDINDIDKIDNVNKTNNKTNNNSEDIDLEETLLCPFMPGQKPDGCLICGS